MFTFENSEMGYQFGLTTRALALVESAAVDNFAKGQFAILASPHFTFRGGELLVRAWHKKGEEKVVKVSGVVPLTKTQAIAVGVAFQGHDIFGTAEDVEEVRVKYPHLYGNGG